jgi:hypothetical protein
VESVGRGEERTKEEEDGWRRWSDAPGIYTFGRPSREAVK